EEIVDAGLSRDRSSGHRVVARDHDGADAHAPQLRKALADAALDDVLEMNEAEQPAVLRHRKRRAAGLGDGIRYCIDLTDLLGTDRWLQHPHSTGRARRSHRGVQEIKDRFDRALAYPRIVGLDTAHPALGGERDKVGVNLREVAPADSVFLLG